LNRIFINSHSLSPLWFAILVPQEEGEGTGGEETNGEEEEEEGTNDDEDDA
jgi:hypothetical protein